MASKPKKSLLELAHKAEFMKPRAAWWERLRINDPACFDEVCELVRAYYRGDLPHVPSISALHHVIVSNRKQITISDVTFRQFCSQVRDGQIAT